MARKTVRKTTTGGGRTNAAAKKGKRLKVKEPRAPKRDSWLTTDEEEVARRKERAQSEKLKAACLDRVSDVLGVWEVWREDAEEPARRRVEIRSGTARINSCDCPDFAKNRLGFCKHVAYVLSRSRRKRLGESTRAELYVGTTTEGALAPQLWAPPTLRPQLTALVADCVDEAWNLRSPHEEAAAVLFRRLRDAGEGVPIWVSPAVKDCLRDWRLRKGLAEAQTQFGEALRRQAGKPAFLKHGLYDYQIDGMLHLAFKGRALLADEMGLGKTVQAIAAAQTLCELRGIRRVLVVTPTSLKAEWEEQIEKFTDLSTRLVFGSRKERLAVYREPNAFFVLTNYEQVLRDYEAINEELRPDLVILDEAQRIKNWKTKTARRIKSLSAPYAFVLTGTPLENRIDELYSLVEFVDPNLLGSLFHFNRRYYAFDETGQVTGVRNLAELHRTVQAVMLRRRKDQIAEQLPERIDNNYFVGMTNEQRVRYDDYDAKVARLMSEAARRPLRPEEHERLQMFLACMRMLCDSVYVLDERFPQSPKVDELVRILSDVWESDPERKVIVFSEWVKMLDLIAVQLDANEVGYATHTGKVSQQKRREEIKRFKNDPACRVFLSTESGGAGLNLQVASVVVNVDLPWNPAKLEQRVARAWRKHQKNVVQVINLVAEKTIEHRMLGTISFKRDLADAVLDARGDVAELEKIQTRAQFLARLSEVMDRTFAESAEREAVVAESATEAPQTAEEVLREELQVTASADVRYCGLTADGGTLVALAEEAGAEAVARAADRSYGREAQAPQVLTVSEAQRELLEKLAAAGVISLHLDALRSLLDRSEPDADAAAKAAARRRREAEPLREEAARQVKMGGVLLDNGFDSEGGAALASGRSLLARAWLVERGAAKIDDVPTSEQLRDALIALAESLNNDQRACFVDPQPDPLQLRSALMLLSHVVD